MTTKYAAKRLSRAMLGMSAAAVVLAGALVARAEPGPDRPQSEQRGPRDGEQRGGGPRDGEQRGGGQRGQREGGRQGDDQGPPPRGPDRATLELMAKELGVTPEKLDEVLKKYRPSPRGENAGRRDTTGRPEGSSGSGGDARTDSRGGGRGDREGGPPPRGERRGGDDEQGPPPPPRDGDRGENQGPPRERREGGGRGRSTERTGERTGQMELVPGDLRDITKL